MAAKKKAAEKAVEERKFAAPSIESFDVIIAPIVTEKTMKQQQEDNTITLKVANKANKAQVKLAVEQIFNVRVDDVRIVNVLPKAKRVGRYEGKVSGYKKAIVKVNAADKLNVVEGE
jgi:large subunit ribosomal protein L23